MKDTPGHSRLPFAAAEVKKVSDICKSMLLQPIEPKSNRVTIMGQFQKYGVQIFHFSGHAQANRVDPLQSYLLLEDWKENPFTVADLLNTNSIVYSQYHLNQLKYSPYHVLPGRGPFLAYLSACGTGQIQDKRFYDENLHLISACQQAGFRHVIGTLWEVQDDICVDVAEIAYQGIRDGGLTDESVCQGLHNATKELRDRWVGTQPDNSGQQKSLKPAIKADLSAGQNETEIQYAGGSDQKRHRLIRNIELCDDDSEDEMMVSLNWVSYVHFGI
jgi:hypothetical protein